MDKEIIKFGPPQAYLEADRLYYNTELKLTNDRDSNMMIIFALTSNVIINSYLAVESFINKKLYDIWDFTKEVKKHKTLIEESSIPFRPFYESYGELKCFDDLKKTELKELKERVKEVYKNYGIKQIHEDDYKLWNDFLTLLEKTRHFLVHPSPDKFNEKIHILGREELRKWPDIASGIIKHFYCQLGKDPPTWVKANTIIAPIEKIKSLSEKG